MGVVNGNFRSKEVFTGEGKGTTKFSEEKDGGRSLDLNTGGIKKCEKRTELFLEAAKVREGLEEQLERD